MNFAKEVPEHAPHKAEEVVSALQTLILMDAILFIHIQPMIAKTQTPQPTLDTLTFRFSEEDKEVNVSKVTSHWLKHQSHLPVFASSIPVQELEQILFSKSKLVAHYLLAQRKARFQSQDIMESLIAPIQFPIALQSESNIAQETAWAKEIVSTINVCVIKAGQVPIAVS